jgi:hypothetical protein
VELERAWNSIHYFVISCSGQLFGCTENLKM